LERKQKKEGEKKREKEKVPNQKSEERKRKEIPDQGSEENKKYAERSLDQTISEQYRIVTK
ncbi:hypothetical protein IOD06_13455, partial [Psychrobacter sp. N25K4-3-2]|nr:hypothetical protein [Psychrobacter sp. N25K4-3-2]